MAKDASNSRIPRLDGVTRIPLPETMRGSHPTIISVNNTRAPQAQFSQILRPTSFTGLRPPILSTTSLKKSLSGERIGEKLKRNIKTVKKNPNKIEKSPITANVTTGNNLNLKRVENSSKAKESSNKTKCFPHVLTRSETFVQEKSDHELFDRTHLIITQSTPLPSAVLKSKTRINDTYSLDDSRIRFKNASDEIKMATSGGNGSHDVSDIHHFFTRGKTINFGQEEERPRHDDHGVAAINETIILDAVTDKNATFINTETSIENLTLLEDVTMPNFDGDCTLKSSIPSSSVTGLIDDSRLNEAEADRQEINESELQLHSTVNKERLLDITPAHRLHLMNITRECANNSRAGYFSPNNTKLLYMTPSTEISASNTDPNEFPAKGAPLKGAQSDLVLPTQTPDDDVKFLESNEPMDVDGISSHTDDLLLFDHTTAAASLQELTNNSNSKQRTRFSLGFDFAESTLDCSIELCDISLSSTVHSSAFLATSIPSSLPSVTQSPSSQNILRKQNSFELDESLGILTPDQMKEFLDSTTTNMMNLDLPIHLQPSKMPFHQMRIDQTPSPEDLPLDPVEVKSDVYEDVLLENHHRQHQQQQQQQQDQQICQQISTNNQQNILQQQQQQQHHQRQPTPNSCTETSQTDTESSKTDQIMTKSNVSKISTSFITSVTSVTSLDTGYQGDIDEMSRPASRGPGDRSPSNGPTTQRKQVSRQPSFNQQNVIPVRRQDPMTDSDFFTESDADDIFHRGDRRAQVIDGQLYGPQLLQPTTASVFISEQPQLEDSCMESSGIFTDVENRCDDDIAQMRRHEQDVDMSPDGDSTDTVKSMKNGGEKQQKQQQQLLIQSDRNHLLWNATNNNRNTKTSTDSSERTSMATDYNPTSNSASNRTSYCGEVVVATDIELTTKASPTKSFSNETLSMGERKNACTKAQTTPTSARSLAAPQHSVRKINVPRKHLSLSSLCPIGGQNGNNRKNLSTSTFNTTPPDIKTNLSAPSSLSFQRELSTAKKCRSNGVTTSAASTTKKPICAARIFGSGLKEKNCGDGGCNSGSDMVHHKSIANSKRNLNQENKSPATATSLTSLLSSPRNSLAGAGGNIRHHVPSPNTRKNIPNKWDAVMNKIANNKSHTKTNYNEVKSKVSTGIAISSRRSPSSFSSSGSTNNINAGLCVVGGNCIGKTASGLCSPPKACINGLPQSKYILSGAAKRGRSFSKDSEQSSQSDLSFSSGSPKLLAKISLRAAKKRDVRNLSISPTDLGPPPKTQQTANDPQNRSKTTTTTTTINPTQKRASNATQQQQLTITPALITATIAPNTNIKGSPPAKKVTISARRGDTKSANAKPLKDHNRPISQPPSQQTTVPTKTNGTFINNVDNKTSASSNNAPHAKTTTTTIVTATSLHSNSAVNNKNNNNNQFHSAPVIEKGKSLLRDSPHPPSSPVLNQNQSNKKISQQTTTAIFDVSKKSLFQKHSLTKQQQLQQQLQVHNPKENAIIENSITTDNLQQEYQLKLLNRYSCNDGGGLDFHSIYRKLLEAKKEEEDVRQDKGIEALGVLLQYIVYDLDAFSCPAVKIDCVKAKENLSKTLKLLDEAKSTCHALQDELFEKESFYNTREEDLQALHRAELEKVNAKLGELQIQAKEHIDILKEQLEQKDVEHKQNLDSYRNELETKLAQKSTELNAAQQREVELLKRIEEQTKTEENLRMKYQKDEEDFALLIQTSTQRERELVDKVNSLSKELERLRQKKEIRERELEDKLNLSKDEISVLRLSQSYNNDSAITLPTTLNVSHGSPRCSSSNGNSNNSGQNGTSYEIQRLQSEAESLRCVLEIKQKEISKLTKQNQELIRDADESLALMGKVSTLESRYEMLQTELSLKSEKEKELREKYDELKKAYNHEALIRKRLSFDNEALQWQLKQRSEQLHIVEAKLHEQAVLSASKANMSDNSINEMNSLNSSLGSLHRTNCSDRTQFQMDDLSPPSSPIIKGVIEKIDSVSWVLEMDDETPETAASKIVKRAGSFRSVERSPSTRRQLSMSVGCSSAALNGSATTNGSCGSSGTNTSGPNPLSQSMSATSVIRQHSNDAAEFLVRAHSRIRSKSVSVKCSEPPCPSVVNKKVARQNSTGSSRKSDWKEPICSSSPYVRNSTTVRSRVSPTITDVDVFAPINNSCNNDDSLVSGGGKQTSDNIDGIYMRQQSNKKTRHHLITCDTSTLNSGEKLEMHSLPSHSSVHDLKVLKKCQEIQESAGEAMVSGTNSEDEGCSASSDEAISTSSTSSGSSTSLNRHHHHHQLQLLRDHHMSIEEALLLDKIHSLNDTPMEVSWSDDPDQFASESTV